MSRRVAFAGAVGALASGALLTMVMSIDRPRPVDVRRVDLDPARPGVLSATHTTTLGVQPSATTAPSTGSPERRPATPVTEVTTAPTTSADPTTTATPTREEPNRNNCDHAYLTDGVCVPWFFPLDPREACEWLREQGLTRIEVQGRDRHHLDLDLDALACEPEGH